MTAKPKHKTSTNSKGQPTYTSYKVYRSTTGYVSFADEKEALAFAKLNDYPRVDKIVQTIIYEEENIQLRRFS